MSIRINFCRAIGAFVPDGDLSILAGYTFHQELTADDLIRISAFA
jgi:hypothetical protein